MPQSRRASATTGDRSAPETPDVVIIVTGSHPHVPALPGLDGKPVMSDRDVLQARVEAGDRVVVVVDVHTQQGLSTAK